MCKGRTGLDALQPADARSNRTSGAETHGGGFTTSAKFDDWKRFNVCNSLREDGSTGFEAVPSFPPAVLVLPLATLTQTRTWSAIFHGAGGFVPYPSDMITDWEARA